MITRDRGIRVIALIVAIAALVVLVGCKGGNSCRKSLEDEPGSTGIGSPSTGGGGGGGTPGSSAANATSDEQEVLSIVNEERAKVGSDALQWCDGLASHARAHSMDMCTRNFFSHTNPEGEGPDNRAKRGHAGSFTFDPIVPDPYPFISENICVGYSTPQQAMNAWMNSSGHRHNLLNSCWTHMGAGRCECDKGHWTQNFGYK